ncbi:hypothetical protein AAMO2058_000410800 [Amorphochlora amoebiformis]
MGDTRTLGKVFAVFLAGSFVRGREFSRIVECGAHGFARWQDRNFSCSGIDLLAYIPSKDIYPTEITGIGDTFRGLVNYSQGLCAACSGQKSEYTAELTDTCKTWVSTLKHFECNEDKYELSESPEICYSCYSALNGKKITPECLLSYGNMCDREIGASDMWGWKDQKTGSEYALLGFRHGITILNIDNASYPHVVTRIPQPDGPYSLKNSSRKLTIAASWWKDVKILADRYMLVTSEAACYGVRAFDLHDLRTAISDTSLEPISVYEGVVSVHNLVISPDTKTVYAVGSNTCKGGFHILDYSDPFHPKFVGCYRKSGYIHDCQCVYYNGPDKHFKKTEICLCGAKDCIKKNKGGLGIFDMTNRTNIKHISCTTYENSSYPHQGWISDSHRYFFMGDESDEMEHHVHTTTLVWDLSELESPTLVTQWQNLNTMSVDHNLFYYRGLITQSNYENGIRILKFNSSASTPSSNLKEIAHFDAFTAPVRVTTSNGTWGHWPFYEDGVVVTSTLNEGVFVLKLQDSILKQMNINPETHRGNGDPRGDSLSYTITYIVSLCLLGGVGIAFIIYWRLRERKVRRGAQYDEVEMIPNE